MRVSFDLANIDVTAVAVAASTLAPVLPWASRARRGHHNGRVWGALAFAQRKIRQAVAQGGAAGAAGLAARKRPRRRRGGWDRHACCDLVQFASGAAVRVAPVAGADASAGRARRATRGIPPGWRAKIWLGRVAPSLPRRCGLDRKPQTPRKAGARCGAERGVRLALSRAKVVTRRCVDYIQNNLYKPENNFFIKIARLTIMTHAK